MSSLCPESASVRIVASLSSAILVALLPAGSLRAAQTYVQPQVDLRAEANDNWELTPGGSSDSDVYGFIADLQALFGIATQRSDTSVLPRIRLQEYPDREDVSGFEGFFDLRSIYRWETSDFLLNVRYSHQDLYNAELPRGEQVFDPLDPNFGSDAESGRVIVGEVRDRLRITPAYTYDLSDRLSIGADVNMDISRYNTDQRDDFDFWKIGAFTTWSLNPRTSIGADVYTSRFETTENTNETDGYGVGVSFVHRQTENIGVEGRLFYESNDVVDFVPVRFEETTSGMGGNLTAFVNGEITQWRFTLEQAFWPTGDGGKSESSQFRAQYRRSLTQHVKFDGTARYFRDRAIGSADDSNDRDYARLELALRYQLAPTWSVSGGYGYTWQEYVDDADDASNNQFFLTVGYRGLDRPYR
jgi:hypothetical protein